MQTTQIGRATVLLEVVGNIDAKLATVMTQLDSLSQMSAQTAQNTAATAESAAGTFMTTWVTAATQVGETLERVGGTMSDWGRGVITDIRGVMDTFMEAGITFQSLQSRFNFEYGANAQQGWTSALDIASRTLLSTQDVVDQSIMLHRSGVDALTAQVRSRTGEMIPAMEALSDLAATKGDRGAFLMQRLMQEFFSGTSESALSHLRMLFDLPKAQMRVYQEGLRTATTAQERFEAFAQVTGQLFGGAGRAMGNTWEFQIAQMQDQWEIFRYEVTQHFLDQIGPVLSTFVTLLQRVRQLEQETHVFSESWNTLGTVITYVVDNMLVPFVDWLSVVLHEHPMLIRNLVALTAGLAGVAIVMGTVLSATGGLILGLIAATATLVTFLVVTAALPAIVVTLGAIAAGAAALYHAWSTNFAGIRAWVERAVLVVRSLWEVLSSTMDGVGHMSQETFDALNEAGLTEWVVDASGALYRLGQAATGFWHGLEAAVSAVWAVVGPVFERMFGMEFSRGVNSSGSLLERFVGYINSMSPEQWEVLGKHVGEFLVTMVTSGQELVDILHVVHGAVLMIVGVVEYLSAMWEELVLSFRATFPMLSFGMSMAQGASRFGGASTGSASGVPSAIRQGVLGSLGDAIPGSGILGLTRELLSARSEFALERPTRAVQAVRVVQDNSPTTSPGGTTADGWSHAPSWTGTGRQAPIQVAVTLDGRRVGEGMVNSEERSRARVGLGAG